MYNIHVHVCREDVNYWDTSQPKLPLLKLSDLYTSLSSFINLSVAWTEPHTVPWRKRNNIEKIWNKKNCNFQMISSYTVVLQLFWITSNLRFLKCFRTLDFSWMSIKHYHSVQSWLVKYCSNNEQKLHLLNVGGNVPICFHPPISEFLLDLEALHSWIISPWQSKLASFQ